MELKRERKLEESKKRLAEVKRKYDSDKNSSKTSKGDYYY